MNSPQALVQPHQHVFVFEQFSIRGAIHHHTDLTIHDDGQWQVESRVSSVVNSFKPRISLHIEFMDEANMGPLSFGEEDTEWHPKCLWSASFRSLQERTIKMSGSSDFIRDHFDELSHHSTGKLKLQLKKQTSLLGRLF